MKEKVFIALAIIIIILLLLAVLKRPFEDYIEEELVGKICTIVPEP